jgi:hypothetical protein
MKHEYREVPAAAESDASFPRTEAYRQTVQKAIEITRQMPPPTLRNHSFTERPQRQTIAARG